MQRKIRVGILFGGKSAEHEVSLQSARNVAEAIDKEKYEVVEIKIEKDGKWSLSWDQLVEEKFDVIFPILHGPFGEDGTVQGLLKLAGIPFVGAGVLGSAVGMDKDVMKRLLREAGIPIGKYLVLREGEKIAFKKVVAALKTPFFVKPANMGSSVGVSKVSSQKEYKEALTEALQFDRKIILEENIQSREIECSVLGNDNPKASVPGEVIVHDAFYSYNTKYIHAEGATLAIPANLPKTKIKEIQKLAVETFKVLNCEGLGRVDFFLKKNGKLYVNEINTIPGFTSVSMYPKLWEASGIGYAELIDILIQLAIERFEKESKLKTSK
jgi:D-alanine-D-alanine ligase